MCEEYISDERNEKLYYFNNDSTIDLVYHNHINTTYPLHTHAKHYTMGFVIDGTISLETDTDTFAIKAGEIFTIPKDIPHAIKPLENPYYTMLTLCIHEDYLFHTSIDAIQKIIDKYLPQTFPGRTDSFELLTDGLLLLQSSQVKSEDTYSNELKQKIMDMPEFTFPIEKMSHEICVSAFHMIRQFKKEVGLTPHQFQIQCRIRKAQKLLLTNLTIAEVSSATGFCDQSHFIKAFKKAIGMPPIAYRQMNNANREPE